MSPTLSASSKRWILWIVAGLLLRIAFVAVPRPSDDDTAVYLELGHNLLHHGIYGIADGAVIDPSLFRLPGYPLLLATIELGFARIWPDGWLNVVFTIQAGADVASGLLLAAFACRYLSPRAAEATLILAMFCPFTAAYSGIGMTECLSVFAVSLGIYAAGRALDHIEAGRQYRPMLILASSAAAMAMLLRPDGAILLAALAGGLFLYTQRESPRQLARARRRHAIGVVELFCLVALLPLVPWTARNWSTFHVFQPLAPRYVNDPGEYVDSGFYRWLRTWSAGFDSTANVFWSVGEQPIDCNDLPASAFDSPRQRDATCSLFAAYNLNNKISSALDSAFAALAVDRIRSHPLRYYAVLPVLRVADMLLRPRTEAFYLDVYWWRGRQHPGQTAAAVLLGLINLGYLGAAIWAFCRRRVPLAWMLGGYLLLRCLLLATVENPEPRYTLECYPILIVASASAFTRRNGSLTERQGVRAPASFVHRQLKLYADPSVRSDSAVRAPGLPLREFLE